MQTDPTSVRTPQPRPAEGKEPSLLHDGPAKEPLSADLLQPPSEHPHGLPDADFDSLFTNDKPIIFAFHGYPWLIHRLTYRRTNHGNLHVRGFKEEGTTTTPFDMTVLNELDRFHLVEDVIDRVPGLGVRAAYVKQAMRDKLIDHKVYVRTHGEDMAEVRDWKWAPDPTVGGTQTYSTDTAADNA